MTALGDVLLARVRAGGPITVADFMAEALGHPRLGYYMTRDPLGSGGDFITAPEISQMFGELIGLWCAEAWSQMGAPEPVVLAELGPGRGTLMADALRALKGVPAFRAALRIHLVETSPVLRSHQARALAEISPVWHDEIDTLPSGPLLMVANEFLDALPIRQFVRTSAGWRERMIGLDGTGNGLAFRLAPQTPSLALIPPAIQAAELPIGSVFETSPASLSIVRHIARRVAVDGGAALFIDYGYDRHRAPTAWRESLQALKAHRPIDVLAEPGAADITAHVDFGALATEAREAGAGFFGPIGQGAFLRSLGIETRLAALSRTATAEQRASLVSGCRRLIEDTEMGTLFKVAAVAAPSVASLPGFT